MLDWLNRYFDLLMVHGDVDFLPRQDSAPFLDRYRGTVVHTGYLTDALVPSRLREAEVLVSAGGGAVGDALFTAAASARGLTSAISSGASDMAWNVSADKELHWRDLAGPGAIIEPVAPDFTDRLAQWRAGHRADRLQHGQRNAGDRHACGHGPFAGGAETEQTRRAERFAAMGYPVVAESRLTTDSLIAAIDTAARLRRMAQIRLNWTWVTLRDLTALMHGCPRITAVLPLPLCALLRDYLESRDRPHSLWRTSICLSKLSSVMVWLLVGARTCFLQALRYAPSSGSKAECRCGRGGHKGRRALAAAAGVEGCVGSSIEILFNLAR